MGIEQPNDPLELKLKINMLLWEELGAQTTLDDAEEMACRIFLMIEASRPDTDDQTPKIKGLPSEFAC